MKRQSFLMLLLAFLLLGMPAAVAQPIIYSESFTSEDAVILQKHDQINIIGKKYGLPFKKLNLYIKKAVYPIITILIKSLIAPAKTKAEIIWLILIGAIKMFCKFLDKTSSNNC